MIHLESISRKLGGRTVLDRLDLHVRAGETYVLLGQSGMGKSVTLKHIVGLLQPDTGRVIVDGEDMSGRRSRRAMSAVRTRIGYVFQSGAFFDLAFGGRIDQVRFVATACIRLDHGGLPSSFNQEEVSR